MSQTAKAFLLAPLIILPIMLLTHIAFAVYANLVDLGTISLNSLALFFINYIIFSVFALIVAYVALFVLGVPYYFYLNRKNHVNKCSLISAAFLAGGVIGALLVEDWDSVLQATAMILYFGFCGAAVAHSFWYLRMKINDGITPL